MCGIAGYCNFQLAQDERRPVLEAMCGAIAHRGPDDQGYFLADSIGLGMRRLSIIDLSTGQQPMHSPDGRYSMVYNGEVYNYQQLRSELQARGRSFSTDSDTEVILAQFEKDGPAGLERLNGMFALAIWDAAQRRLFLARDRMGIKPLYYYWDGRRLIFGSEIKAILASRLVQAEVNLNAVWDFLTFRYVPQPNTIWQNIHKLPPGHSLSLSLGGEPRVERYWDIPYQDLPARAEAEYDQEFEELFLEAVGYRLIADVPVGIMLSGGLDSSCVAAAVALKHNVRLNSFSVSFADSPDIDELPFARQVAKHIGTDHHEVTIGPQDFLDFLPELVYYTDEPLADLASVPLYYLSRLAKQSVKVVLSGEGSDEILAGYDLEQWVRRWDRARSWQRLPAWLRKSLLPRLAPGQRARLDVLNLPVDQSQRTLPPVMTNHMTSAEKRALFKGGLEFPDSLDGPRAEVARTASRDPLHQLLYGFCQGWLVEDLLMKADRMSMANSLELRVPFLDHRLVEWAARTPSLIKAGRDAAGNYQSKRVLRHFAQKHLPPEIIARPKMGFPVPVYDWLSGRFKDWAWGLLGGADTAICAWLEPVEVKRLLTAGTAAQAGLMDRHRLWDLIILELWGRKWRGA